VINTATTKNKKQRFGESRIDPKTSAHGSRSRQDKNNGVGPSSSSNEMTDDSLLPPVTEQEPVNTGMHIGSDRQGESGA
jgi:hypothetical protein